VHREIQQQKMANVEFSTKVKHPLSDGRQVKFKFDFQIPFASSRQSIAQSDGATLQK